MTLLSRKADYALLILSYLHRKPVGGTARAIAEASGLSRPFVANILKELGHHGFVQSHRGVKGGYVLARPADTVTLAELLESVEDGFRLTVCNTGSGRATDAGHENCSHAGACTLKGSIAEVHRRLLAVLRSITLAELFDPAGGLSQPAALLTLPVLADGACGVAETSRA
ncbi:MAG: Rrf2 family transcriptional regulator [Isosphaera sp.]|nr:Rrf2 family transcriptional regulator [Isosphaera sp.]